jgi:UDP-GlcNAc:undecaprenyl-phosphate/decaprenyl-phosphate GlcNAc-1-phosphate transferase
MVLHLMIAFAASVGMSLVLTPAVMKLAAAVGAMDYPNARKVHSTPMPRMGGVAICGSFFISFIVLAVIDPPLFLNTWLSTPEGISLAAVLLLVLSLGIWDDIEPLMPSQKFVVQLLLSTIIYLAGFRISTISLPIVNQTISLGYFDYPLTMMWMIGITNAINLIDGLDGLASGVATIAFLTVFPIAMFNGDMGTACMALLLAGSLVGFLKFNFNPARIFLGDSGSLFLGFALSVLSIHSSTKGSAAFAIVVPILALGLPIMDTFLSMARRLLRSFLPNQPQSESFLHKLKSMFQPDKSHIHHRLIARGLSHRNAVLVLYGISCLLGLGAFSLTVMNSLGASLVLGAVGTATVIGVRQLRYKEMAVLQNGVLLPLYDRPIMNREALQVFFDVAFILISFGAAKYVTGWLYALPAQEDTHVMELLAGAAVIQLSVFWMSGLYRGTFRLVGLGDVLRTLKSVAIAVLATGGAMFFLAFPLRADQTVTLVLDFYFLMTLVVGFRMSFRVLQYLSHQDMLEGKRVLLYGADASGVVMLERILESNLTNYTPIGFLDDDATLEGKSLNGYPIFGGHWKLSSLLRTIGVDEIVLCSDSIKDESLRRLHLTAFEHKIPVKRLRILFEDYHPEERKNTVGHTPAIVEASVPIVEEDVPDVAVTVAVSQLEPHRLGGVKYAPMKSKFA